MASQHPLHSSIQARRRSGISRRGLTLVESLIAAVLLVTVVTAVLGALSAGHQHAMEAKRLITASLAAEQLMAQVTTTPYSQLGQWDGWDETPGTAMNANDEALPGLFELIGRRVIVRSSSEQLDEVQIILMGSIVTIESYGADGRILARLVRFIPEPQA